MENRFGLKDFVLFGLLIVLIGVVLLAMVQYDHQHAQLNALVDTQQRQAEDLGQIQATLKGLRATDVPMAAAGGTGGGPTTAAATESATDPFARVRAAQTMPGYAPGDMMVYYGPSVNKLTPLLNTDSFAGDVQDIVLQSLLTRNEVTLDWQPLLAEPGWTVVDHVADYLAYTKAHPRPAPADPDLPTPPDPAAPSPIVLTFKIRPEATFADGQPVTAEDVVWTFGWIMNQQVEAARQRAYFGKIRRVTQTGERQVTFEFAEPYFDYLGLAGGMSVLPKHHYGHYAPADYNQVPCDLLGSGPYQLSSPTGWHPGEEVQLVRNEKYWGPKPALASLRYRIIIQDLVKLTAFKNGELDRLQANPVQFDALTKNKAVLDRTQHFAYETPTAGYRFIAWNEQPRGGKAEPFADARVRQAMTMLIDRQRICDDILNGYAHVVTGPFSRLGKQCDPAIKPWPFDVGRAQALLADAGWKDDGAGSLRNAGGDPLQFKLTYPTGSPLVDRMVLFMRDTMAQAGVKLDPDPLDWSIFEERLKNHEFDALMMGWTAGLEGDIYQMFHSSQIAGGGEDWMGYRNPELDRLIEQARQTVDADRRNGLWRQCHAILHADQPYTFMTSSQQLLFLDKRFANVRKVSVGLNDMAEWFVPGPEQKYTN